MSWKRFFGWIVRLLFVGAVTALAWFHLAASIMFVCSVVLIAIGGKLESLVEFSFGPLRAKIERNLSESEKLLDGLKNLASIQARSLNAASVHTGRFGSADDWIFQSVKRNEAGLRAIGLSEDEVREARSDFVRLTVRDAGQAAIGGGYVPQKLGKIAVAEWQELTKDSVGDPDAVEAFLIKWDALSPERLERIEDMRWMIKHQDVRDSEQYMRANSGVGWD